MAAGGLRGAVGYAGCAMRSVSTASLTDSSVGLFLGDQRTGCPALGERTSRIARPSPTVTAIAPISNASL